MKRVKVLLFIFLLCYNCNNDDKSDVYCTEVFVSGLNVTLLDAITSQVITDDVEVTITDGSYQETLINIENSSVFIGAGERPGTYIINVTSPNYESYISGPIVVTSDICHVIPQIIEIMLQPL